MEETGAGSRPGELPTARIASLLLWLNSLSLSFIVFSAVLGMFEDPAGNLLIYHIIAGFSACLLGLFGLVSAMFYLITTGAAVREALRGKKNSAGFNRRMANLKKNLFSWCMASIFLLLTATVVGGGVHVGKIPAYVHLALSIAVVFVYVKTVRRMKENFHENRVIMADALMALDS